MRKIECKDIAGVTVQEVLDEFNERRGEFEIEDEDIIGFSTRTDPEPHNILFVGKSVKSTVIVTIFYWTD